MTTIIKALTGAVLGSLICVFLTGCGGGSGPNGASARIRLAEPVAASRSDIEAWADIRIDSFVNASVQHIALRVPVINGAIEAEVRCPAAPTAIELELHNATFQSGVSVANGLKVLVPGPNEMMLYARGNPLAIAGVMAMELMNQAPDTLAQAGEGVWQFLEELAQVGVTNAAEALRRIQERLGS